VVRHECASFGLLNALGIPKWILSFQLRGNRTNE
jgi:hypothetical protein